MRMKTYMVLPLLFLCITACSSNKLVSKEPMDKVYNCQDMMSKPSTKIDDCSYTGVVTHLIEQSLAPGLRAEVFVKDASDQIMPAKVLNKEHEKQCDAKGHCIYVAKLLGSVTFYYENGRKIGTLPVFIYQNYTVHRMD